MRSTVLTIFTFFGSLSLYAADTELKLYRPFGEVNPSVPLIIKEKHAGHCSQQSQKIAREDAWRCSVKNKIYDPCFVKQYGSHKETLCPQSPWVGDTVQIELTEAVDNAGHTPLDVSKAYPWAVKLLSGEQCQAIDEGKVFDNLPIHYQCDNQSVLFGYIQRCKMPWTILQRGKDGTVETAAIKKAWF